MTKRARQHGPDLARRRHPQSRHRLRRGAGPPYGLSRSAIYRTTDAQDVSVCFRRTGASDSSWTNNPDLFAGSGRWRCTLGARALLRNTWRSGYELPQPRRPSSEAAAVGWRCSPRGPSPFRIGVMRLELRFMRALCDGRVGRAVRESVPRRAPVLRRPDALPAPPLERPGVPSTCQKPAENRGLLGP